MSDRVFDLVVAGGGAGGLTAAREARRRDARVAIVAGGPLGGDCTFTGCVPSKTLLAAAARGEAFGPAMDRVRRTVAEVAATEDAATLRGEGIEVIEGWARVAGASRLEIDGASVVADRVVLATGADPAVPNVEGLRALLDVGDGRVVTSETVWGLDTLPARLGVLGAGAVGCELAQAFARLGSEVTLLEAADRILPVEEPDASAVVGDALAADGVAVHTAASLGAVVEDRSAGHGASGAGLTSAGDDPASGGRAPGLRLETGDGTPVVVDRLLVAVGRRPSTAGLGLEVAGVEVGERGEIVTDDSLATTAPGIWAVGDVTARLPFTHAAGAMAEVAVGNALGGRLRPTRRFHSDPVPWVTFTDPEVGRVGITEAGAAGAHPGARVAEVPFDELDRGITAGRTDGFVRLVVGPRRLTRDAGGGRLLGATAVGPTGGELIAEPALAMRAGMFPGRLAQATHAYPTWGLAIQLAAAQFFRVQDGRQARPARDRAG